MAVLWVSTTAGLLVVQKGSEKVVQRERKWAADTVERMVDKLAAK